MKVKKKAHFAVERFLSVSDSILLRGRFFVECVSARVIHSTERLSLACFFRRYNVRDKKNRKTGTGTTPAYFISTDKYVPS